MTAQIKQEDIMAKYQDLPEDLQKALVSSSFSNAITEVGKKNGLAIDKVGELADETGLVMLGITSPSEYVKNLASRLSVNQEKARAIAEEINQKVFQPVRESLKKIHGIASETKKPEALKPLPKRGDIVAPPKPPRSSTLGVETPKTPSVLPRGGELPPIFVKKMPEPLAPQPDIVPAPKEPLPQNSIAAKTELEKTLSMENIKPKTPQYDKDPYRETIES